MSMKAKDNSTSGSKFAPADPLDPGSYPARLVQVISLGLQKQQPYKGEDRSPKHEFYTTYELLDEFMKDEDGNDNPEKPRWLSERFPINSLDSENAKSTKRYLALDPENKHDGDWVEVLGSPVMLEIVQNPSKKDSKVIYNNIRGSNPMRAKDAKNAPKLVNETKVFDFDEPDLSVFLSLPKFLQTIIQESLDYEGSKLEELVLGAGDDKEPSSNDESKEKGDESDW